jgi:hypothetical protein
VAEEVVSCQLSVVSCQLSAAEPKVSSEIFHWRHLSFFISSRFDYAPIEMQTTTDASGSKPTDN